jgi:DNA-binding MarR family transcriptional regulator
MANNSSKPNAISLQEFLPYRLVNLAQRISANFAEVYQSEFNLTMPEWRVLVHLAEHTHLDKQRAVNEHNSTNGKVNEITNETANEKLGISAKELTIQASMDKSTVSRAVKLMLNKGYISKLPQVTDKRAYTLKLTTLGSSLYQTIAPKALAWETRLLEVLNTAEYQTLMRVLAKLDGKLA